MYGYVLELHALVRALPGATGRHRHHGPFDGRPWRLVLALRNPALFRSVSALAPVCAPSYCPWGDFIAASTKTIFPFTSSG